MNFNYELPDRIANYIKNAVLSEISIGCSDSQVFKIVSGDNTSFLKIAKLGLLEKEYNALKWLDGKLAVPKVIEFIQTEVAEFLLTEAIKGEMVCSEKHLSNQDLALDIIAQAFNNIYNVNIDDCPLDVSNHYKLSLITKNVNDNLISEGSLKEETLKKFGSVRGLLDYLQNNSFEEELVFSHGDTSLPNIFADNNQFSGFIDVGECGIADKWFDLAICEKSIVRNFGKEYVERFYNKLNIIPDRNKINYYLLMMELYL